MSVRKIILLANYGNLDAGVRVDRAHARGRAGWTSLRIDTETHRKLAWLAATLPKLANPGGSFHGLKLVDFLSLVANAEPLSLDSMHVCPDPAAHVVARIHRVEQW